jgi:hypothetical protein
VPSIEMDSRVRAFLLDGKRIAKVSTRRKNGDPWVQPAWFDVDGDDLIHVISRHSLLGRAVTRECELCVCVDDVKVPYGFAILEGRVAVIDDQGLALQWMARLIRRYRDDVRDVEAHAQMLRDEYGLTPVRVQVDAVTFEPVVSPPPATSSPEEVN